MRSLKICTPYPILYSLSNIVLVIKSRRMSWAGHAARMGERMFMFMFRAPKLMLKIHCSL